MLTIVWGDVPDIFSLLEADIPFLGLIDSRDEVEKGRLSRAVRADKGRNPSPGYIGIHICDGCNAAKGEAGAAHL